MEISDIDYDADNTKQIAAKQHSTKTQSHFRTTSTISFDLPSSRTYFKTKY